MERVKGKQVRILHDLVTVSRESCFIWKSLGKTGKTGNTVLISKSGNLPFIMVREKFSRPRGIGRTFIRDNCLKVIFALVCVD